MNLCKLAVLEGLLNTLIDAEKCVSVVDAVWPVEIRGESERRRHALRTLKDIKKRKGVDGRVANLEEILEMMRDKDDEELKMTIRHREHAMRIIDGIKSYPCSFLFGEVSSNYIVFLIDCSGSMVGSEAFVGG